MSLFFRTAITALGPIFWGTTYLVTTEYLPDNKPFLAAFIRCLPAGLLLIIISQSMPKYNEWAKLIILGFLNIGCFQATLFIAAYKLPGGIASVIGSLQPLIVLGLIWKKDQIKPSWITFSACLFAIMGVALLTLSPNNTLSTIGIIAALTGALSMGLGTYLSKKWHHTLPMAGFTGWQLLFGSLFLLPITIAFDFPIPHLSITNITAYAYLIIFGTVVAYWLWFKGIEQLPAVAVSTLGTLSTLTAACLGWVCLDQHLSGASLLGFVLVIISVLVVQISTHKSQH